MYVLPVSGLFVMTVFKALDTVHTARYLHMPVCIPFLNLRLHIDVSCGVLPSEENDEGADRGLHSGYKLLISDLSALSGSYRLRDFGL
jgi:hypothetical protein